MKGMDGSNPSAGVNRDRQDQLTRAGQRLAWNKLPNGAFVYRLGHGPLKAERRVRFPYALPIAQTQKITRLFNCRPWNRGPLALWKGTLRDRIGLLSGPLIIHSRIGFLPKIGAQLDARLPPVTLTHVHCATYPNSVFRNRMDLTAGRVKVAIRPFTEKACPYYTGVFVSPAPGRCQ